MGTTENVFLGTFQLLFPDIYSVADLQTNVSVRHWYCPLKVDPGEFHGVTYGYLVERCSL